MKLVLMVAVALLAVGAIVYGGDYASVRYKIAKSRDPFGKVKMESYYAVPKKDGRVEFMFNDPIEQPCLQSMFPHLGYAPCWYLKRIKVKRIDV